MDLLAPANRQGPQPRRTRACRSAAASSPERLVLVGDLNEQHAAGLSFCVAVRQSAALSSAQIVAPALGEKLIAAQDPHTQGGHHE